MARSEEQSHECPLCMDPLEIDDLNFFPCTCGYQICRFCWHRIRTDENGLCPACRKQYPEDPADFKPVSVEEVQRIKNEKRQKDLQKKQKVSDKRKSLSQVRVVQNNLVFVVGLPPRLADSDVLKKAEYFGKYGKLHKIVVNNCTSYAGSQGPSASAYVTYEKAEDALNALQAVNNIQVDGRSLKASLGTTKYCSHFLRNQQCPKPDCMYLHEFGAVAGSFTKEEMQQGKHQEYERKLIEQILDANRKNTLSSNSSDSEETWPLPSDNQHISVNSKIPEDQIRHITFDHNSRENGICENNPSQKRKGGKNSNCNQICELSEKSLDAVRRNSSLPIDVLQCKLENVCVSSDSSSSSRESLYSANSDGQTSINNTNSCENIAKSDSDYETDKTDREVQHELFNVAGPRKSSCSESPEFFSSNSSLSTPDSTMSDGPLPFSPSSSPIVNSHFQVFPKKNCLQTSEARPYVVKKFGLPPGFGLHAPEMNGCTPNLPAAKESSLNNHSDWDSLTDTQRLKNLKSHLHWQSTVDTTQDDDLGFDPFDESNKGLADLLQQEAKERANNTAKAKSNVATSSRIDDSFYSRLSTHLPPQQLSKMPPPGFQSAPTDYFTGRSPLLNDCVMPPLSNHIQRIPQNISRDPCQDYVPNQHLMNNFISPSTSHGALNAKLDRLYAKEQEGFKALLPNINVTFDPLGRLSSRLPPGLTPNQKVNNQREDYSWPHDPAIVSSGNVTTGSTWTGNSSQWVTQQLLAEENARKYNSYINAYYRSFPSRAQPSLPVQTPPPGFNLSLRPLQTFPENGKTNDSQWYFGRM